MPSVAFITLGCKVNQAETDAMAGLFLQAGFRVLSDREYADVYVVNTCSVTHLGERKSRQMIRRATRQNPQAVIAVTGCFAQLSPAETAEMEGVDIVLGTQDRRRIVEYVEEARQNRQKMCRVQDIMAVHDFEDIPLSGMMGRTRAFLKIQDGCDNYCSYCIIPYARGHLRSRSLESIARQTELISAAGFHEIVLTGINLAAYGRETGKFDLVDAMKVVLKDPRITRLRLSSTESIEISPALIQLMVEEPRVCAHLHLPLQSGEDTILMAMRRTYQTRDYARLLESLRNRVPDLAVTTDIIVGFPGETEEKFQRALDFVNGLDFAKIHVFPYSKRQGTPAAEFAGQVSETDKKRRVAEMLAVGEQSGNRFRARLLGRTMPVLIEKIQGEIAEGLTANYQRVQVSDAPKNQVANQLLEVKLESITPDGFAGRLQKSILPDKLKER